MIFPRCRPFLLASLVSLPLGLAALPARAEVRSEYEQVRKIALRDRRVREAFQRAYERLDARILELDPALSGYVRTHPSGQPGEAPRPIPTREGSAAPARPAAARPAPARPPATHPAASRPKAKPAPAASTRRHTVGPGETLSSIAALYETSVPRLTAANHIQDARKLRVGQTLVIP